MKLRIALFARVSSAQQAAADKNSLDAQVAEIDKACTELGAQIVARYVGVESATKGKAGGDRRRGILESLLADAASPDCPWNAVMVAHEDRWSRDQREALNTLARLTELGKSFYVLGTKMDYQEDDEQSLSMGMRLLFAQYEDRRKRKRVLLGKLTAAGKGRWPIRAIPYGLALSADRTTFTVDPKAQAKLQQVYRLTVEKKLSQNQVAAKLGEVTQPGWALRVDTLIERIRNGHKQVLTMGGRRFEYPAPEVIALSHLLAIKEHWKANRTTGLRIGAHPFAMGGKVKCGNCGSILQGYSRRGRRDYHHEARTWKDANCIRSVVARQADYLVFGMLGKALASRQNIEQIVAAGLDERAAESARIEEELRDERRRRAKLLEQEEAIQISVQHVSDERQRARTRARLDLAAQDINTSEARIEQLEQEKAAVAQRGDAVERAAKFVEMAVGRYRNIVPEIRYWTIAQKRELMDVLFGEGSLRQTAQSPEQRMATGVFLSRRGVRLIADVRTQVPLFDDATLQKLARRMSGNVPPSHIASACRPTSD